MPDTRPTADELAKLTKSELVEQLLAQRDAADRFEDEIARRRTSAGPEAAFAALALVEMHRATAHEPGARYLEAARVLCDDLVKSILPVERG